MKGEKLSGRRIKQKVEAILRTGDIRRVLMELDNLPSNRAVQPLFSFLYDGDEMIKWGAVTGLGVLTSKLADENLEVARTIIRRLMWNLNDESGGIGWGSPEAMGEILANHERLAKEFTHILVSYARKDGNYQENPVMQRGVLWAIGRLAQVRAQCLQAAIPHLTDFLYSNDISLRGHACWVMGLLHALDARERIYALKKDQSMLRIFKGQKLLHCRVGELADEALNKMAIEREKND